MSETLVDRTLRVAFSSFWLCGSGRGDGPGADELPITTRDGLPFVPGKTLRGVLRDAFSRLAGPQCDSGIGAQELVKWFGSPPWGPGAPPDDAHRVERLEADRYATTQGRFVVGSAVLGRTEDERDRWRRWAQRSKDAVAQAFVELSTTRINDDGVADDQTLRTVRAVIPMTLFADVRLPAEAAAPLREAVVVASAIGVGSGRHRGFGRVCIDIEPAEGADA
ncbi:MAG: hypothetical protein AMXMBFR64_05520 [Myxococcales bacterium]